MFLEALIIGIIIGYILKGKLKNLENVKLKYPYLAVGAFAVEFILFSLVRKGMLSRGYLTTSIYIIEYALIFLFIYFNRENKYILIMGLGFLLNALAIFSNGGAMPVSAKAAVTAGLAPSIGSVKASAEGLYVVQNEATRLWLLGDIIPKTYLRHYVISIGDIVAAIGLLIFLVQGMRSKMIN
ncbi:hypothetical protein SAMN05443428_12412 [Caloramator quimbayensis]|uniref:DUF5317 domain-containing protein n=1 Tax=Caloramator quimbayensis TaxID=1147123 RepID=A0A1T4Y5V1_9CLOT|nr:DUF5317 domain-containing protein [Caloramator quimbayensis]SKA97187.1 hypothetical protein SAMN05443428_12412 [Caloramator quimbayensis]